jgi:hypothetical protein
MVKENKPSENHLRNKSYEEDRAESKPSVKLEEISVGLIAESMPTVAPPVVGEEIGFQGFGAGWYSNTRIIGLWSINQNRNCWIAIQGVGWRRLGNASDSGIVALTTLCAHALEKSSTVNVLEESGLITQMYVW